MAITPEEVAETLSMVSQQNLDLHALSHVFAHEPHVPDGGTALGREARRGLHEVGTDP